ncbi:hypothetical protein KUTeg_008443 [Tegillarca granosa]|uniref:Uncharacterized protein n=1 Tax=Tegillarca granosa TaxID=220873 RepID=A0ABQ9F956_TEGGR|nr:hypothetical protein KUTeg_008443 [Tegillarca granosa]
MRQSTFGVQKAMVQIRLGRMDSHVYTRTAILSSWRHNSQNSRAHSLNEPSFDSTGGLRQFRTTRNNNDKSHGKHVKTTPPRSRSMDNRNNMLAGGVKMETCVNSNCRFLTLPEKKNQKHDEIELSDSV